MSLTIQHFHARSMVAIPVVTEKHWAGVEVFYAALHPLSHK